VSVYHKSVFYHLVNVRLILFYTLSLFSKLFIREIVAGQIRWPNNESEMFQLDIQGFCKRRNTTDQLFKGVME